MEEEINKEYQLGDQITNPDESLTLINYGLPIKTADFLRMRDKNMWNGLKYIDDDRPVLPTDVMEQVNIELKYDGYIKRQMRQVEQFNKLENKRIPSTINYHDIYSLRKEAEQKLSEIRPASVGQAARISGVSPADISVLLVYLEKNK